MAASIKTWTDNSSPQCAAADLNGFELENNTLIASVDLTLNDLDHTQTTIAVACYAANGDFYTDGGIVNAYVLTPQNLGGGGYRAPFVYAPGMRVRFITPNANTGASTINVAGLGVVPILANDGSALVGGEIVAGRILELSANAGATAFLLIDGGTAGAGVPTGAILDFGGGTVPDDFLGCDGSAVSRTTYATLFGKIGVIWGVGDGSTTFNLPDLRGRTTIGAGTGSGLTPRVVGDIGGEETHILSVPELASHAHGYNVVQSGSGVSSGSGLTIAGATTGGAGSNAGHNNMQPFGVCTKIIKT